MKKSIIVILIACCSLVIRAQKGGSSTYDFLNLTSSAKVGALGGNNISLKDSTDLNMAYHNPALLHASMDNSLVFNFVPYVGDTQYGYVGFGKEFKNVGTFSIGIMNMNYGEFDRADDVGNILGTFSAAEYSFNIAYSRQFSPNFSMGMAIKPIYSKMDTYQSFGIATDFGIAYFKAESGFSFGATIKNLGSQITSYDDTYEELPTDFQIGISKKLKHAPFRFSITAQNLLVWDTDIENEDDNYVIDDISFGDNLLRHMVFGVEFLPTKNFHVDFGYNHKRRKELGYSEKMSTAGFSWGFGFKAYKFHVAYGSARYHLGGTSNHFSISTNLSSF
ncbi:type IX secretion system protein PorQ [Saccharicrinis aurantiacus]|uniref:type IX secretion system protein PorQ n=1 Tax=Saccharicrinis aurantiacus TaxID=1849719 RepID=UPI0024905CA7|nr:type IX secretion system protein PorQ [Saccharicrinis aurantiacus]